MTNTNIHFIFYNVYNISCLFFKSIYSPPLFFNRIFGRLGSICNNVKINPQEVRCRIYLLESGR